MALDPNIALGVRGIEVANPLAQYAQISQLQSAQNQNALARYQLSAAQRADEQQNKLYAAVQQPDFKLDFASAIKYGAPGIAAFKAQTEAEAAGLTRTKTQGEINRQNVDILDLKLKQSRAFLDTLNPADPNAPQQYLQWHQANHSDPVIGPALKARGVSVDQSRAQIDAAIAQGPQAFAQLLNQSKLGTEKFMELNKPTTTAGPTGIVQIPGLGGPATVVPGTGGAFQMTPAQIESNKIAKDRLAFEQGKFAWEKANPGYEIKEAEDGSIVGVNKKTLQAFPVTVGGAAPAAAPAMPGGGVPGARLPAPGTGPTAPGMAPPAAGAPGVPLMGKGTALTESQGNATAYGLRMKEANSILEDLAKKGTLRGANIEATPFIGESLGKILPSFLAGTSAAQQQVNQAKSNFITAVLRKESGAVISDSEFEREDRKYFPQVNDNDAVIKQKANARKLAIKAMEIQAGPGAKNIQKYQPSSGIPGASANDPLGLGTGD